MGEFRVVIASNAAKTIPENKIDVLYFGNYFLTASIHSYWPKTNGGGQECIDVTKKSNQEEMYKIRDNYQTQVEWKNPTDWTNY